MDKLSRWRRQSYAQQGEDLVAFRCLRQHCGMPLEHQGFYVDLGAFHPVKDSNTKMYYDRGWRGLNVDMQRESVAAFHEHRSEDITVWCAISDTDGTLEVYVPESGISVHSSANPKIRDIMAARDMPMQCITVPAYRVDTLLHTHGVTDIDYMNIDLEGLELAALKSMDFDRWRPKCISVEVHAPSLEAVIESDIFQFMKAQGYRFVASTVITQFFVS